MHVRGHEVICYCLVNFDSTTEEDLYRIYTLRAMNIQPYVMIYDKEHCDPFYRKLQRYVNRPQIFWSNETYEFPSEYFKCFSILPSIFQLSN